MTDYTPKPPLVLDDMGSFPCGCVLMMFVVFVIVLATFAARAN